MLQATVGPWELPAGINISPSIYLLHRRADPFPTIPHPLPTPYLAPIHTPPISNHASVAEQIASEPTQLYCPNCAKPVDDPLTCGDCGSVICRACGTPLESSDELAMG